MDLTPDEAAQAIRLRVKRAASVGAAAEARQQALHPALPAAHRLVGGQTMRPLRDLNGTPEEVAGEKKRGLAPRCCASLYLSHLE